MLVMAARIELAACPGMSRLLKEASHIAKKQGHQLWATATRLQLAAHVDVVAFNGELTRDFGSLTMSHVTRCKNKCNLLVCKTLTGRVF